MNDRDQTGKTAISSRAATRSRRRMKAGRNVEKVLIARESEQGQSIRRLMALAKDNGAVVQVVDSRKLDGLSTNRPSPGSHRHGHPHPICGAGGDIGRGQGVGQSLR